jgi:hypothetical protein
MTIIFIMKGKTTFRKLDLYQENGQKGTATITKEQKWLRRKQENIETTSISLKVITARLIMKEAGEG